RSSAGPARGSTSTRSDPDSIRVARPPQPRRTLRAFLLLAAPGVDQRPHARGRPDVGPGGRSSLQVGGEVGHSGPPSPRAGARGRGSYSRRSCRIIEPVDRRVLEFIGDLRRAEIRISPSEALDALAASAEIGLTDRDLFKAALASTLVKESRDLPTFERLF